MRTAGLIEADTTPWVHVLDDDERGRAARFVFERHRTTFIAAHVLTRCVLSRIHPSQGPAAWRFVPGEHGKPVAWAPVAAPPRAGTAYEPARLTFNLSHTEGLVGLATLLIPGQRLGFDVEPVARPVNLDVADRFFRPEETAWLRSLPEAGRPEGFLRLWTLKEAFIKATGEGLARDLASFWFRVPEAAISFVPSTRTASETGEMVDGSADQPAEWQFEQRMVGNAHLAAIGLQRPAGSHTAASWVEVEPAMLRDNGAGLPNG